MSRFTGTPLANARSVLFLHAHPDDESISTGALMAALAEEGRRVVLVTATRGERGEIVPGPLSSLMGTPALAAHRERELAGALAQLGDIEHFFLGLPPARAAGLPPRAYADSGMRWVRPGVAGPGEDAGPLALSSAPIAEITGDLLAACERIQPDAIISYDEEGGYGHPDHVRCHEAARLVSQRMGVPGYGIVLPGGIGAEDSPQFADEAAQERVSSWPGDSCWLELADCLPRQRAALRHHATQLTVDGDVMVHSGGQRQLIRPSIGLLRWTE